MWGHIDGGEDAWKMQAHQEAPCALEELEGAEQNGAGGGQGEVCYRLARPGLRLPETHTVHVPPPLRVGGMLALQPFPQGTP